MPHLQLIGCDDAWDLLDTVPNLLGGSPDITIAVADVNGVVPDHPDLTGVLTNGQAKLVATWNFFANTIVQQAAGATGGDHGTQCAGSATARFQDGRGLCGVAPNCGLLGARIRSNDLDFADMYLWLAGFWNGSLDPGFPTALPARTADVISSSFGANGHQLSNTMRDCFDFLTSFGRNGRGCVVCFSLGNTGYIEFTNATAALHRCWPTYEKVIAVGASISVNPTSPTSSVHVDPVTGSQAGLAAVVDTRAFYSPYGGAGLRKPDLVSPSHTSYAQVGGAVVDPIMSCVPVGSGNVNGCTMGTCDDYRASFGGTSHATPTVAGAAALILSARPDLTWIEVRDILHRSCVKIDTANGDAIGQWEDLDGDNAIDFSRWYGFGRLDVEAAVQRALDTTAPRADCYVRENQADIGDVPSPGWHAHSPDIWVRQTDDPIPGLAWSSDPPHENAERGQDNYVFCRTMNRGSAAAGTVYLRASITHYPGFEFRYPQEFQPTYPTGSTLPATLTAGTYLIGEARIDNLGIGADRIVKMTWPEALIPPLTVVVGGATVFWHPCLLLEVSPHDGPAMDTSVTAVRGSNNLAQRNIAIDDIQPDADGKWFGMVAGSSAPRGVSTLVVEGVGLTGRRRVRLSLLDERLMKEFAKAVKRLASVPQPKPKPGPGRPPIRPPAISVRESGKEAYVEIDGLAGSVELPLALRSGQLVPMRAAMAAGTGGMLRLSQRRADGQISPGYAIKR